MFKVRNDELVNANAKIPHCRDIERQSVYNVCTSQIGIGIGIEQACQDPHDQYLDCSCNVRHQIMLNVTAHSTPF